jgi:hypothetical protein
MSLPTYNTFAEKDTVFCREQIDTYDALMVRLNALQAEGYYFRGQSDAGWKLYSGIQREWILKGLGGKLSSAEEFNERHLRYQQQHTGSALDNHTQQRNDLADSSALQHYGAPTPFLDFTSAVDAALHFATDGMAAEVERETSQRFSIYAWKPGDGPATASHNDMTNWEKVVEDSGGIEGAVGLFVLKLVSIIYIKQDSGKFLQIANERVDLQKGLFVYSPKAVREGVPYEEMFTGMTVHDVTGHYDGLFIPKMICLDVSKATATDVAQYLEQHGVSRDSLGLASDDWARQNYDSFIKTLSS